MPDPSLSEVHADLVGRLEHDKRIRLLEQGQARMEALIADMPRMEARIMSAIESTRAKSPWPAVGALAAVLAVVLVVAAALYGQKP